VQQNRTPPQILETNIALLFIEKSFFDDSPEVLLETGLKLIMQNINTINYATIACF